MFLEDSTFGRKVWRELYLTLLNKVSELFPIVLEQESLRDGPLCYTAVKVHGKQHASQISPSHSLETCVISLNDLFLLSLQVCLQMFQLLSSEVAPLVWDKVPEGPTVQSILQALMDIILGQVSDFD